MTALELAGVGNGSSLEAQSSVLWTYPADGAGGIPTNAQLLVSSEGGIGLPRLNGVELAPSPSGVFELGELSPHTTYRVTWSWEGDSSVSKSVSFTTGDGPLLDALPVPGAVEVTRSPGTGHCPLRAKAAAERELAHVEQLHLRVAAAECEAAHQRRWRRLLQRRRIVLARAGRHPDRGQRPGDGR